MAIRMEGGTPPKPKPKAAEKTAPKKAAAKPKGKFKMPPRSVIEEMDPQARYEFEMFLLAEPSQEPVGTPEGEPSKGWFIAHPPKSKLVASSTRVPTKNPSLMLDKAMFIAKPKKKTKPSKAF